MLKKISYTLPILAVALAGTPVFADQENVVPVASGGMEAKAVQDSTQSTQAVSNSAEQSAKTSMHQSMNNQSNYYGYEGMPAPKRYQAPPVFHVIVGGQLGYGFLSGDDVSGYNKNDNGNIFGGVFVGADYLWNPMLATGLQLGYYYGPDLLKYDGNSGNSDQKVSDTMMIPLLATVKVNLPMHFNVFVKGGIAYVNQDVESKTHKDYNGVLSGGVGYQIQNWNIFAEYMYVFGREDALGDQNHTFPINSITVGVSYNFPVM